MRIISGKRKGRKIRAPFVEEIRPTTDYAKTGLFNVLNNNMDFEGIKVLDLFSGFGNIAFEFASRGALLVDAIDIHPQSIKFIKQFAKEAQLSVNAHQSDVLLYLKKCHQKYNIIFADPPFDKANILPTILNIIIERELLQPDGIIVFEHQNKNEFLNHPYLFDNRKYGKVHFSFFSISKNNTHSE